jgi:hypothetical protein
MRAAGWNKMQLDAVARLGQPFLHQFGVMIAGVIEEDLNEPHRESSI